MSWIQDVVSSHSESESPEKFFYWAALTAISAVTRKNVYLDKFTYKLYPNIYTFLIAGSGMKKGLPVTLARKLVDKVNCTRVIMGRNSVQRVIQDLGKAYTLENGGVIKNAEGFLVSGELAAFLVKDADALTILTDIYDTHAYEDFWKNSLKGNGTGQVDKLLSPCLTLLGATNEEHFADAVPGNAIGGGFIARTFIVLANVGGQLNSLMYPPKQVVDINCLALGLREISNMKGEITIDIEGKKLYDNWYYGFMGKKFHDPTGTLRRLGDQVLKVACLLSLSNFRLQITPDHIFEAITVCEECVNGMQQVTMGSGQQNLAASTKVIVRELILNPAHQVNKSILLHKYWGQFDDFDITRIAETLQAAGAIEIIPKGKDTIYKMRQSALDMYLDFKRGIQ